MNIYYHLSDYISHRESGFDFIECLRSLGHHVTVREEDLLLADVAILHDNPLVYPKIFLKNPRLHTIRTIAYTVWESIKLPLQYIEPLKLVNEIWTCSHFSKRAIAQYFDNVSVVPHVIKRIPVQEETLDQIKKSINIPKESFYFFTIVDAVNPRKNIFGLLSLFCKLRESLGNQVTLILKQYREIIDFSHIPGIFSISDYLTKEQIAALHIISDSYISTHHCEGWGLGISEAMAYGKPVIATGYSGNMEYMNTENSFPIPFTMRPVSDLMCERVPLFTKDMEWAEVDCIAFEKTMQKVARGKTEPEITYKASQVATIFGKKAISSIMQDLLRCNKSIKLY